MSEFRDVFRLSFGSTFELNNGNYNNIGEVIVQAKIDSEQDKVLLKFKNNNQCTTIPISNINWDNNKNGYNKHHNILPNHEIEITINDIKLPNTISFFIYYVIEISTFTPDELEEYKNIEDKARKQYFLENKTYDKNSRRPKDLPDHQIYPYKLYNEFSFTLDKVNNGGYNKITFIKNGKKYTRKLQFNNRKTKCIMFKGKLIPISKLKIV